MKRIILILLLLQGFLWGQSGKMVFDNSILGRIVVDNTNTNRIDINNCPDCYGVWWDDATATPRTGRTGLLADYNSDGLGDAWSTMDISLFTIQNKMKGCIVNDAREIVYYLNEDDWAYKEDGVTPSMLDGTDGQVMVEIPEFWYRFSKSGTINYLDISETEAVGFDRIPHQFIGAYEASFDGVKLESVSGDSIQTSKTISQFRGYAEARGSGWYQQSYQAYLALYMLYITEYANFDTQAVLSYGLANASSADWSAYNDYNPIVATGESNSLGNNSGEVSVTINNWGDGTKTLNTQVMRYRGIENWYAHIWKILDGCNIYNSSAFGSQAFICNNPENFASDTQTNYILVGNLAESDGYITSFLNGTFLSKTIGGSSATYMTDSYFTIYDTSIDSGWRMGLTGGIALYGGIAGAFCVYSNYDSSVVTTSIGARLCCGGE